MKRLTAYLTCIILLLSAGALCAADAPDIASRLLDLYPRPGEAVTPGDTGLYSMHLGLDGKTMWLGRANGVRKVDLASGNWKFIPSTECAGDSIIAMADTGDALWVLTHPDGLICRFDYATSRWHMPGGWKMREHVFGGDKLTYVPSTAATGTLYLNGQGGPDSEGISLIDTGKQEWGGLFKTKPVFDFQVVSNGIIAATWDGILTIDVKTGEYRYTLHSRHGCGARVSSLLIPACAPDRGCRAASTQSPYVIATRPAEHTELGEAMKVFQDGIAVFAPTPGSPYSFRWRYYGRNESKRLNADYYRLFQAREFDTPGGICRHDAGGWQQLFDKDGLPGNTVVKLAASGKTLYAATGKGLAVISLPDMEVIKIFPEVKDVIEMIVAPGGLWIASDGGPAYFLTAETLTGTKAVADQTGD